MCFNLVSRSFVLGKWDALWQKGLVCGVKGPFMHFKAFAVMRNSLWKLTIVRVRFLIFLKVCSVDLLSRLILYIYIHLLSRLFDLLSRLVDLLSRFGSAPNAPHEAPFSKSYNFPKEVFLKFKNGRIVSHLEFSK